MATAEQIEHGQRRLAALRHRSHRIRVWVACVAVTMFLAAFGAVYVQMSMGQDPALGSTTTSAVVTSATGDGSTTASEASAQAASGSVAGGADVTPMTTRQS
jgi:hypothetical protein